jgi:hypothetical protein
MRLKELILRQNGLKFGTFKSIINAMESQLHIILFRAQVIDHRIIKTYLKERKINVNLKAVNGISHMIYPGDLITLNFFPLLLIERIKKRKLRLNEQHIITDFKAGSISILNAKLNTINTRFIFRTGGFNNLLLTKIKYVNHIK